MQNKSLQMSYKSPNLGMYKENKSRLTEMNFFYSFALLSWQMHKLIPMSAANNEETTAFQSLSYIM